MITLNFNKRCSKAIGKKQAKAGKYAYDDFDETTLNDGFKCMLASPYDPDRHDPAGWYMSEKLDGVRCIWDGQELYSRYGNKFNPPDYIKSALPKDFPLDGELWTKRNDFQSCVSIIKR